jgi:hypothetical protein
MILKCTCKNEYQDKEYGKNKRVHNRTEKVEGKMYRCTVCSSERLK